MRALWVSIFAMYLGTACGPSTRIIDESDDKTPDSGPGITFNTEPMDAGTGVLDPEEPNDLECDADGDGYESQACSGNDCNDDDPLIHPQARERCSFVDENCSGTNNEFLDCSFMAAGPYDLYRVDPFVPEVEWLSNVQNANSSGGMLDIDTDTEGQLVIVKKDGLYALNSSGDLVATEGFENIDGQTVELSPYTNGMAINSAGTLFLTNSEEDRSTTPYESAAAAHTVQDNTGVISVLGSLAPYVSSGDCVALKNDSILMTARYPSDQEGTDLLVLLNSDTAQTTLIEGHGLRKNLWFISQFLAFFLGHRRR